MLRYHIQTIELASAQAVISFNNIPQDYTDIFAVYSLRNDQNPGVAVSNVNIALNGSTSNFSNITLGSNGSNSYRQPSTSGLFIVNSAASTANTFGSGSVHIPNYSKSNNKNISVDNGIENNQTASWLEITSSVWSQAVPVTSLAFITGGTFAVGSSISLYGVRRGEDRVTKVSPVATGGTVTTSGGHTIHTFTSSGTLSVYQDLNVEYLVVAGGGGGGKGRAGGGGAGGYLAGSSVIYSGQSYPIAVGAGGVAGSGGSSITYDGRNGSNSIFNNISSIGGGGGQGDTYPFTSVFKNGGSGGGANLWGDPAGTGIPGQGNDGGWSPSGYLFSGQPGGGGGAGAPGGNVVVATQAGAGGAGLSSSITGSAVFRAGGGGGGADGSGTPGAGGIGGGGAGSNTTSTATSGTSNTGGGGGGGWRRASDGALYDGGAGGSGIVIIRYLTP